eukprot:142927-Rhodomonas_salina.2
MGVSAQAQQICKVGASYGLGGKGKSGFFFSRSVTSVTGLPQSKVVKTNSEQNCTVPRDKCPCRAGTGSDGGVNLKGPFNLARARCQCSGQKVTFGHAGLRG